MKMHIFYRIGAPLRAAIGRCPVAVAGTRNPTPIGIRLAREVGRMLAEKGYTVVSGFARGIDEETALSALDAGGRVVAVLPYLFEAYGALNPRAAKLLRIATSFNAAVSIVSENPVKDDRRVRTWLAVRSKLVAHIAAALIVPEARYKRVGWGTRYAVEHATSMGRPVVVIEPHVAYHDVVKAFKHFKQLGALAVKDGSEALSIVMQRCSK
jgi:DNA processing protein